MATTLPDALPAPATHKGVSYRPDIDGLRTIAVLAVVLYHADIGPFSGGFIGVDVFFVISGFLIMSTLTSDLTAGRFSVLAFYERRIRRIFPALFTMMAIVTAVAALVFLPAEFAAHGKALVAAATSLSNVFFYATSSTAGYFDNASETRLLLHTWSLSVEEQFYVLLPVALMLLRGRSRRTLALALALFAAASFALSLVLVAYRPMDAFYLVLPRAWELLAGCLLAVCNVPAIDRRWLREAAAALGVAMIAVAVFDYTRATAFPGAAALLPCAGALLLIHAGKVAKGSDGATLVGRVLSASPSVYVGRISYSLYLWHWPIIVFVGQAALVRGLDSGELGARAKILILVASFAAAILSYHLVEQPFRGKGALSRILTRPRLIGGGLSTAVLASLVGAVIVAGSGFPQRYDSASRVTIAANLAREADRPAPGCENWKTRPLNWSQVDSCPDDRGEPRTILFWGDSHVWSLRPLVHALHDENALGHRGEVYAIAAACPPSEHMNNALPGYSCGRFAKLAMERAAKPDVDTVFIAFAPWWDASDGRLCRTSGDDRCTKTLGRHEAEALLVEDMTHAVHILRAEGKKVVLQLPAPSYDVYVPRYEINEVVYGSATRLLRAAGVIRPLERNDHDSLREGLLGIAHAEGATVYDPKASLCSGELCDAARDGVSLYIDDNHLANSQIGLLHDGLRDALDNVGPNDAKTASRE